MDAVCLRAALGRRPVAAIAPAALTRALARAPRAFARPRHFFADAQATPASASSTVARRSGHPRDAGTLFGAAATKESVSFLKESYEGFFYQKLLPAAQVAFASPEGKRLFHEALGAGHMENYFFLAEQFRTQNEPAFCGLSTLVMVLNALHIDPMRTWKGAWRWFSETNLGCCVGPDQVREEGLTLGMFQCLAGCNGAQATVHRAPLEAEGRESLKDFTDLFRAAVRATCRSQMREFLVVCYTRDALGQSGSGHFSPIGGYHEESDSVLIMDVARFKYPPHWVRLEDLVGAMLPIDEDTGRTRGYVHLRPQPSAVDPGCLERPLHAPFVPKAAGRRLSKALAASLARGGPPPPEVAGGSSSRGAWALGAMCRWLQAAQSVEPQVLRQLLHVGNVAALWELLESIRCNPPFSELCDAYEQLVSLGLCEDFPALCLDRHGYPARELDRLDVGLKTVGELWVLMLLLLPREFRTAIAPELDRPWAFQEFSRSSKVLWAEHLEAIEADLGRVLRMPEGEDCGAR